MSGKNDIKNYQIYSEQSKEIRRGTFDARKFAIESDLTSVNCRTINVILFTLWHNFVFCWCIYDVDQTEVFKNNLYSLLWKNSFWS